MLKGLTSDSRNVKPGYLFAALPGERLDGHNYIPQALSQGATAILYDGSVELENHITALQVPRENLHKNFAKLTGKFYNAQPEWAVAVTGTNGKSSVVEFISQIWNSIGVKGQAIGTLSGTLTTPDPVTLHETLKSLQNDGITHVALEASSHGLAQFRMDGMKVQIAAFTNLSQDHLDYHKTMNEYLSCKARLFTEVLTNAGIAILNADCPEYQTLQAICDAREITVLSYGRQADTIVLKNVEIEGFSQRCEIEVMGKHYAFLFPLIGEFQIMNALCALGCIIAQKDVDANDAIEALENLKSVKGRLQNITNKTQTLHAYVDYAHTPDALKTVLQTLRPYTKKRLVCVFGCGGDRDQDKREQMGKIATAYADHVIITDDNPRNENPDKIRAEIKQGAASAVEISDRREAISHAVQLLEYGDVLLVAGKGHEQGQIIGDQIKEFDDFTEVTSVLVDRE